MSVAEAVIKSDTKVISLIGIAHFFSHFYQLTLASLFPLMLAQGYSPLELGSLTATLFIASAICQPPAGFLTDKVGARPLLLGGMLLMSGSMTAFVIADSYPVMLVLAALAGVGNSVFHPADFSILNGSVQKERMGRAFSVHHFGGYIGYALAPFLMIRLGQAVGWQAAVTIVGALGLIVAGLIWINRNDLRDCGVDQGIIPNPIKSEIRSLFKPSFVLAFLFFALMAIGSVGMMKFGATTLIQLIGIDETLANDAISLQLCGTILGVLAGGYIADRIARHDYVTVLVVLLAAVILQAVPALGLTQPIEFIPVMIVFGFLYGIAGPMRDMVIRTITPSGAAGKVFGFTYSGMDVGSAVAGFMFGAFLQWKEPAFVFYGVALFMVAGVSMVILARSLALRDQVRTAEA